MVEFVFFCNKQFILVRGGTLMYCNKCGSVIQDGSAFCNKCGSSVGGVPNYVRTEQYTFPPSYNKMRVKSTSGLICEVILLSIICFLFGGLVWGTVATVLITLTNLWKTDSLAYYKEGKDYETAYTLYKRAKLMNKIFFVCFILWVIGILVSCTVIGGTALWGAGMLM